MALRMNKRLAKPFNINKQKLKGMKDMSEVNLKKKKKKNRFEKLEEVTARNISEIIKEEANELAGKTKEEPSVLPIEVQEIRQLEDRGEN